MLSLPKQTPADPVDALFFLLIVVFSEVFVVLSRCF